MYVCKHYLCCKVHIGIRCIAAEQGAHAHPESRAGKTSAWRMAHDCGVRLFREYKTMKVHSRFLSHLRLDQSYSLLSGRDVSIALEFFKALDIRGEMALDGMTESRICCYVGTIYLSSILRYPVLCLHAHRH